MDTSGLDAGPVGAGHLLYRLLPPGPAHKKRRFATRYGAQFDSYRAAVPNALPRLPKDRPRVQ
jgi:hypothetical protein